MTDKKPRKRAKALPILDIPSNPGALWNYGPGVVYDPELPESVRAAIPPGWVAMLDMPAFTTALGVALGHYRYYTALTGGALSPTQALKDTKQAARMLEEAITHLHHLPPLAKSLLDLRTQTEPDHARTMLDRALALDAVFTDLRWAIAEIERQFARRGRKSSGLRDALFTDVRDLILAHATGDPTKQAAAELLCRLMRAARIPIPAKLEDVQRRIRDVEHAREQEVEAFFATPPAPASRGNNSA
ncbi:MAG TPA: hypothetical protein VGE64_06020 [Xanthomonadaceae bacterium]